METVTFDTSFTDETDKSDQVAAEWRRYHPRSTAPAHKSEATFVPVRMIFWKLSFLIRVLLMKSTEVTDLPQSGEGTMHEVPRLRTKVMGG